MKRVLLNWPANVYYGWGIVGLNLLCHLARDPDLRALMGEPIAEADFTAVDPLRIYGCHQAIAETNAFQPHVRTAAASGNRLAIPVVDSLGNGLVSRTPFTGTLTLGRCIFEDTRLVELDAKLAKYDSLITASRWNAALLEANCRKRVTILHEGIDPSLFHPAPKSGFLDPNRFYIFSGGKVEFRKGHDLTLLAFREFSRRHDDAMLVTLWHSPWPKLSAGFQGRLAAPLGLTAQGLVDISRWVAANGIDPKKVVELPRTPNPQMPEILREMDCALAPSRAEACTNLLVKEAMACGIPTIVSDNTGVQDLIGVDNCVALTRQQPVRAFEASGTDGWGESDVEEIVAALERLYTDSRWRRDVGSRGARWLIEQGRTWENHAKALKSLILSS